MKISNIVYSEKSERCVLDLYLPDGVCDPPLYLYIHGGGLTAGSKDSGENVNIGNSLSEMGIATAVLSYRLYPNAKYPEYIEDCADAAAFLYRHASEYGGFSKFCIGGSSAGGYISMMLMLDKKYLKNAGVPEGTVKGFVLDAGQPTVHFNYLAVEKKTDPRIVRIDETAPLYYVDGNFSENEPHAVIFCSDHDMINRKEQLEVLHTAMLQFGYPKEKLGFYCFENTKHCSYINSKLYYEKTAELIESAESHRI